MAAVLVALAGCTGLAKDIDALSADKNAVCLTLTTPWGTEQYSRNGGCGAIPMAPAVITSK